MARARRSPNVFNAAGQVLGSDDGSYNVCEAIVAGLVEALGAAVSGGACFAAETPVETEAGEKPIADIAVGDKVWSQDEATGERELRPVVQKYVTPDQALLDLDIAVGSKDEVLRATPSHRFWVDGKGWTHAEDLRPGDTFDLYAGNHAVFVQSLRESETSTVYNLEVEGTHTYFVGDSGVWVHNGCVIGRGKDLGRPGALGPGEYKLKWPTTLPSSGTATSAELEVEWGVNAGYLQNEMQNLEPIRDASPGDIEGFFLNRERDLLGNSGWSYDSSTGYWNPPK